MAKEKEKTEEPSSTFEVIDVTPTALESLERANIDMQIATAKRFPRSLTVVKKKMLEMATIDQETAAGCFYKLKRRGRDGTKIIEGESVRLAEIAVSCFGNMRYGARNIGNDGKTVKGQGYCYDLENNNHCQWESERRITDSNGNVYSEDMQVVTANAAAALAFRNAVFKVVPKAFIRSVFLAAKKAAVGDIKTLEQRRAKMLEQFSAMGVNASRVCASVNKAGVEEIGLDELETLIGFYTAIKEGEEKIDEVFPIITRAQVPITPEEPSKPNGKKPDKLSLKERKNISSEVPPNLKEALNRLAEENFAPAHLMIIAHDNEWIRSDEEWPLSEERLAKFLGGDNWSTIMKGLRKLSPQE